MGFLSPASVVQNVGSADGGDSRGFLFLFICILLGPLFSVVQGVRWFVGIKEVGIAIPMKAPSVISLSASCVPPQLYKA